MNGKLHNVGGHSTSDADDAFLTVLRLVMERGHSVDAATSKSVGSNHESKELLNAAVIIENPRERLTWNPARRLNLPAAVARFVWMMAGSDRLADIAFYEPKAKFFSDDGIAIPGSNYGQRLLRARPGLNQLEAIIRRLTADPTSRRAAATIFQPEDAVRDSKDIPCTFGLFYHIRSGRLHATTIMRSNNAYVLMPYNLFEFSLLAEVVAAEVGVPLGTLTHFAASLHVYDSSYDAVRKLISAPPLTTKHASVPPIGSERPLEEIRKLVILEAELRHASAGLTASNSENWIKAGESRLSPYWRQLYYLLLVHVSVQNKDAAGVENIRSVLDEPWASYLPETTALIPATSSEMEHLELSEEPYRSRFVLLHDTPSHRELEDHVRNWEVRNSDVLKWSEFVDLQRHLVRQVAARGEAASMTQSAVDAAIADIRKPR